MQNATQMMTAENAIAKIPTDIAEYADHILDNSFSSPGLFDDMCKRAIKWEALT
jgi:hypothetical protein